MWIYSLRSPLNHVSIPDCYTVTLTYEWVILPILHLLPRQGRRNPIHDIIKLGAISWLNQIRGILTLWCLRVISLTWFTWAGSALFITFFLFVLRITSWKQHKNMYRYYKAIMSNVVSFTNCEPSKSRGLYFAGYIFIINLVVFFSI